MEAPEYVPSFSEAEIAGIRKWHEAAYEEIRNALPLQMSYLGIELTVPEHVFPPAPMSELLGRAVLAEARDSDRVLDMGTGSGVNAILAASASTEVVGVDINPLAVQCAAANAERNGVASRTTFMLSDVFDAVEGTFDLIIFDPPFRWFAPRDLLDTAMADEGYRALTRFVTQAPDHLASDGRILLFFGTSGDIGYLYDLTDSVGFRREVASRRELNRGDVTVEYFAFRLVREGGKGPDEPAE